MDLDADPLYTARHALSLPHFKRRRAILCRRSRPSAAHPCPPPPVAPWPMPSTPGGLLHCPLASYTARHHRPWPLSVAHALCRPLSHSTGLPSSQMLCQHSLHSHKNVGATAHRIVTESRLEGGGVNRANLKFTNLITTTSRVSVRNIIESEREGAKQIASG
jgi:hypothetical protein